MIEHDIAIVYIARGGEGGLESVRRFIDSYKSRRSGQEHSLKIVTKGWRTQSELRELHSVFEDVRCDILSLPDDGFDLGAYFRAAKQLEATWLLCLNTHSVLLADNWLSTLFACVKLSGVGAAGATGSWESHYTTHRRMLRPNQTFGSVRRFADLTLHRYHFRPFPNVHLRTNAFIMRRSLLVSFAARAGIPSTKERAYVLESGRSGLTSYLLRQGLGVMVCGADGRAFKVNEWPASQTFFVGRQANLLVGDNQTRRYSEADSRHRGAMQLAAWGTVDATVL